MLRWAQRFNTPSTSSFRCGKTFANSRKTNSHVLEAHPDCVPVRKKATVKESQQQEESAGNIDIKQEVLDLDKTPEEEKESCSRPVSGDQDPLRTVGCAHVEVFSENDKWSAI